MHSISSRSPDLKSVTPHPSLLSETENAINERCSAHASIHELLGACSDALNEAAIILVDTIRSNRRVFTCGNGGSASEAQHFAAELVGRFQIDRCAYPAMSLTADTSAITAIGNDYGFEHIFSRQIEGLAGPGDALVAFSTSGTSPNVVRAATVARNHDLRIIAVTGAAPNPLADMADVALAVPSSDTPTIQEFHMLFTHILCGVAENALTHETTGGRS